MSIYTLFFFLEIVVICLFPLNLNEAYSNIKLNNLYFMYLTKLLKENVHGINEIYYWKFSPRLSNHTWTNLLNQDWMFWYFELQNIFTNLHISWYATYLCVKQLHFVSLHVSPTKKSLLTTNCTYFHCANVLNV